MIVTSSAGSKRGWLWDTYSQIGGRPHDHVVVLRGSTLRFNPSISERQLERIRERDPHNYSREYEYSFSVARTNSIQSATVDAAARPTAAPLAPRDEVTYFCGGDFSGKRDAAAMAIGHVEQGAAGEPSKVVIDLVDRVLPMPGVPLDMPSLVARFAQTMAAYRCTRILADQWSAVALAGEFRRHGIELVEETATNKSKLEHFGKAREAMYAGRVSIPGDAVLTRELRDLQEIATGAGNTRIDHPTSSSSDVACAVVWCVAAVELTPPAPIAAFGEADIEDIAAIFEMARPISRPINNIFRWWKEEES